MRAAFNAFFSFFATLFIAANRGATALDHMAQWAEEEAKAFNDQSAVERKARLDKIKAELKALPSKAA